jgi:hypothetical protein
LWLHVAVTAGYQELCSDGSTTGVDLVMVHWAVTGAAAHELIQEQLKHGAVVAAAACGL